MSKASAALIPPLSRRHQVAHVSGCCGDALDPRILIQDLLKLLDVHAFVGEHVQQQAGIDGAGTGGHHQPFERREAHGGGDRAPTVDCRQRAATAQMTAHQLDFLFLPAEQRGGALGTVGVRKTMEPEALRDSTHRSSIACRAPRDHIDRRMALEVLSRPCEGIVRVL
jgi:hypothetical protein